MFRHLAVATGMLFSLLLFVPAAGMATESPSDLVLVDFTNPEVAAALKLPTSAEYTRSGAITTKWAGADLSRDLNLTVSQSDWTEYAYLEMWMYSEVATNSTFVLAISSENPSSSGVDYYHVTVTIDWTGWKLLSYRIGDKGSDFSKARSPRGWDKIDKIYFWPKFGRNVMDPATTLYLDQIKLVKTQSSAAASASFTAPVRALTAAEQNALAVVKQQFTEVYLQGASDSTRAAGLAAALRPDGSWPDILYTADYSSNWSNWPLVEHPNRIVVMARAFADPTSHLYHDDSIRQKIIDAVTYWLDHDYRSPNWFHNRISVPDALGDTALLMGEYMPAALANDIARFVLQRNPPDQNNNDAGANLLSTAVARVKIALLRGDYDLLANMYNRVAAELRTVSAMKSETWRQQYWQGFVKVKFADDYTEGIQVDRSFQQHGPLLYFGGYGTGYAQNAANLAYIARGTDLLPAAALKDLVDYILDGLQWAVYNSTLDFSAVGRGIISGSSGNGSFLPDVAQRLLEIPGIPRKDELAALVARQSQGASTVEPLSGNRHFWRSDYMIQRRPNYFASVRMSSNRTLAAEIVNWQNLRGRNLGDGAVFTYLSGREYDNIFPAWDWNRVPGTTAEQKGFPPITAQHVAVPGSASDFAGGVSNGRNGAAAMHLTREALSAKKAWFFLDNEYVALGTDIQSAGSNSIITSVEQRLYKGDVSYFNGNSIGVAKRGTHDLAPSSWIHHDGIGYVFLDQTGVVLRNDVQLGKTRDITQAGSDRITGQDVFSLWIDHGKAVSDATYAYRVVPGVTVEELQQYLQENPLTVLSNSAALQAVWQEKSGMLQAVFHQPGQVTTPGGLTVAVDQPVLLLLQRSGNRLELSLASPQSLPLSVNVSVNQKLQGADWDEKTQTSTVRVTLPGGDYAGQSVTAVYEIDG